MLAPVRSHAPDKAQQALILSAKETGDAQGVKAALRAGANPTQRFLGLSPLEWACLHRHDAAVGVLLKDQRVKETMDMPGIAGMTAVHRSVSVDALTLRRADSAQCVALLHRAGAQLVRPTAIGGTILHIAAQQGFVRIVRWVLHVPEVMDIRFLSARCEGRTAMQVAERYHRASVVALLAGATSIAFAWMRRARMLRLAAQAATVILPTTLAVEVTDETVGEGGGGGGGGGGGAAAGAATVRKGNTTAGGAAAGGSAAAAAAAASAAGGGGIARAMTPEPVTDENNNKNKSNKMPAGGKKAGSPPTAVPPQIGSPMLMSPMPAGSRYCTPKSRRRQRRRLSPGVESALSPGTELTMEFAPMKLNSPSPQMPPTSRSRALFDDDSNPCAPDASTPLQKLHRLLASPRVGGADPNDSASRLLKQVTLFL